MRRYSSDIKTAIRRLRSQGNTYSQIRTELKIDIPKSSFSFLCEGVELPKEYSEMVKKMNYESLGKARSIAAASNRLKKIRMLEDLNKMNEPISMRIRDKETAKIALAMLCLGEASKSKARTSFSLGNSDPRVIVLFLQLLKHCYSFQPERVRCTVQCRADQDTVRLEKYWEEITGVSKNQFYKTRIDPRTVGKPTLHEEYKGVLKVDYLDKKVQFDLENLAQLLYNTVHSGPVV